MKLQDGSRKTFIAGLERLLAQLQANEPELPAIRSFRLRLEQVLEQLELADRRQEILTRDRKQATREVHQRKRAARDLVLQIEGLLKASLGPRNRRLLRFGFAILGGRPKGAPPADKMKGAPPATTKQQ